MSQHVNDPDAIERDLQATRSRLDTRLSELARRLSPGQIMDEGLDFLRTREGVDFTRNLSVAVRERPIPVALVGVGLAWLIAGPRDHGHPSSPDRRLGQTRVRQVPSDDVVTRAWNAGRDVVRQTGETDVDYRGRVTDARGKVLGIVRSLQETAKSYADRVQDALFAARDRVSDAVAGASDRIGIVSGKIGDTMQGVGDRLGDTAQGVRDQASALGDRLTGSAHDLRDQASAVGSRISDMASSGMRQARSSAGSASGLMSAIGDNPVLLGAIGLAAGALLGALLPPTEIEREYLGEAAHDARDMIEGVVRDATDRGSEVAHAAYDAGRQTVQEVTRHASELGGAAADTARDVAGQAQRHVGELGDKTRDAARDVASQATNTTDGVQPRP